MDTGAFTVQCPSSAIIDSFATFTLYPPIWGEIETVLVEEVRS